MQGKRKSCLRYIRFFETILSMVSKEIKIKNAIVTRFLKKNLDFLNFFIEDELVFHLKKIIELYLSQKKKRNSIYLP